MNNSILELFGRRASGACPDALPLVQTRTCLIREHAIHGVRKRFSTAKPVKL